MPNRLHIFTCPIDAEMYCGLTGRWPLPGQELPFEIDNQNLVRFQAGSTGVARLNSERDRYRECER